MSKILSSQKPSSKFSTNFMMSTGKFHVCFNSPLPSLLASDPKRTTSRVRKLPIHLKKLREPSPSRNCWGTPPLSNYLWSLQSGTWWRIKLKKMSQGSTSGRFITCFAHSPTNRLCSAKRARRWSDRVSKGWSKPKCCGLPVKFTRPRSTVSLCQCHWWCQDFRSIKLCPNILIVRTSLKSGLIPPSSKELVLIEYMFLLSDL